MIFTDVAAANAALLDLYRDASRHECVAARGRVTLPFLLPGFALVLHQVVPGEEDLDNVGGDTIYLARFIRVLAETAGLRTVACQRVDDGSDPFVREVAVTLAGTDLLMRQRQWVERYELDLRDEGPRARRLGRGLPVARSHITSRAATGAYCRAVVAALAIPRGYGDARMARLPVVVPTLEVHLASAPQEIRDRVTMAALEQAMGIYGGGARLPQPLLPAAGPQLALEAPVEDLEIGEGLDPEVVPPLDVDEELPFAAANADNAEDPDRPMTDGEVDRLRRRGVYRASTLSPLGWTGEGRPTLAIYRAALARYDGGEA